MNGIQEGSDGSGVQGNNLAITVHEVDIILGIVAARFGRKMQCTFRIIQAVLRVVRYIFNDESNAVTFKMLQDIHNLFLTDGKCLVILIDPTGIGLMKGKAAAAGIFP